MRARLVVAAIAVGLLAGCGDDDDTGPLSRHATTPRVSALLDRVPGESILVSAMDLGVARRQLGLPPTLAPADPSGEAGVDAARRRFGEAALKPLRYLALPDVPAVARAIDHGQVTGAVDAQIDGQDGALHEVVILATEQSRREIQHGLKRRGWRRNADGFYVRRPEGLDPEAFRVIGFGTGFVVGATSRALARRVVRQTHAPSSRFAAQRRLLENVRGALRTVFVHRDLDAPCLRAYAGGQRFEAHGDEDLVLALSQPADAERVLLGTGERLRTPSTRDFTVRDTTVSANMLRMTLGLADDADAESSADFLVAGDATPRDFYRCA